MPCIKKASLPRRRYSKRGFKGWFGGDSRTLYTFTDARTGRKVVYPGGGRGKKLMQSPGDGPGTVRLATKREAERYWQKPLHGGWKYSCPRK